LKNFNPRLTFDVGMPDLQPGRDSSPRYVVLTRDRQRIAGIVLSLIPEIEEKLVDVLNPAEGVTPEFVELMPRG